MRSTSRAGAAFASIALLLTACSSSSSGGGGTTTTPSGPGTSTSGTATTSTSAASGGTLVVWADNSANTAKAIEPLCQKWAAANGVTCTVRKFNGGSELEDALTKGNATGDVPDIYEGAHNGIGKFVTNGILAPVDLSATKDKFQPAAVAAVTYNGSTYGVPWAVENVAMMTNKTLSPTCPATLDDTVTAAKALIAAGKVTPGLGIAVQVGQTGDGYHWYPLYSADGGYSFKQNADGSFDPKDLGVGKEGSVAAAKRLKQLVADGMVKASVTYDIAREAFSKGKAAFFITGPWQLPDQKKALGDNLMICPVPSWKGSSDTSKPFLGVRVFFQTAKAKNAVLASTFLSDEVETTDFMDGMYSVDPRPPAWLESYAKAAADPYVKGFGEYGKDGTPMPNIPQMDAVFADLGLAEYKIASGQDPTSTIVAAGAAINKTNASI